MNKLRVFLEMIKFEHTIFALPFAYLGYELGRRGGWVLEEILWVAVAMVAARTAGMCLNRLIDEPFDRGDDGCRADPVGFDQILQGMTVSASGLSAERVRMDVIAQNIANAQATRGDEGGPYRRREVVFAAALGRAMASHRGPTPAGVEVVDVREDPSEFPRVHRPGHPDADPAGYVLMPNVDVALEMVDLIGAARAYEANLAAMRTYREMAERALAIGR